MRLNNSPTAEVVGCEAAFRAASAFLGSVPIALESPDVRPLTNVYIDGHNLYHGAVEHTPYRWLNIGLMCETVLPRNEIQDIHYFTAPASNSPDNPDRSVQQRIYWRALDTLPNLTRHEGNFAARPRKYPLARARAFDDPDDPTLVHLVVGGPTTAIVMHTEEKGSDVNLAANLLADAFRATMAVAVVVSNDADLIEPIRIVTHELGIPVGVVNPRPKHFSPKLAAVAGFKRNLHKAVVKKCQFPDDLEDERGTFSKPADW